MKKRQLNQLFALNRRVMKAYLLTESLTRLWDYTYEGAMLRYLQSWIDQLRWQRLCLFSCSAGFSRKCIGWALQRSLEPALVLEGIVGARISGT